MSKELTEDEMGELGFERFGALYVAFEDGAICFAFALPNGNAPVGGNYYQVYPLAK